MKGVKNHSTKNQEKRGITLCWERKKRGQYFYRSKDGEMEIYCPFCTLKSVYLNNFLGMEKNLLYQSKRRRKLKKRKKNKIQEKKRSKSFLSV